MDTIGLLAAWVGIISCLVAAVMAIGALVLSTSLPRLLAKFSKVEAQKRLDKLLLEREAAIQTPDIAYLADLISLYGTMILNLVAAIGLVIVSIEVLDVGPALLAATLPFSVNSKLLMRFTGILILGLSYYFILRLSYLAVRMWLRKNRSGSTNPESASREISRLQSRLG
jgi:hypothetical protein